MARNDFGSIPKFIKNLCKFMLLDVSFCYRLQCLPELPCQLEYVKAQSCISLQTFSNFINCLKLDWDALGNILTDALQKLEQTSIHWREAYEVFLQLSRQMMSISLSSYRHFFPFINMTIFFVQMVWQEFLCPWKWNSKVVWLSDCRMLYRAATWFTQS